MHKSNSKCGMVKAREKGVASNMVQANEKLCTWVEGSIVEMLHWKNL